jgi:hypothetical protein
MLTLTLVLSLAAFTALAVPSTPLVVNDQQWALVDDVLGEGFNVDLNELRLVQFENGEPEWMTEKEKV